MTLPPNNSNNNPPTEFDDSTEQNAHFQCKRHFKLTNKQTLHYQTMSMEEIWQSGLRLVEMQL